MPKLMVILDSPGPSIRRGADTEQKRYFEYAHFRDIMPDCLGEPNGPLHPSQPRY